MSDAATGLPTFTTDPGCADCTVVPFAPTVHSSFAFIGHAVEAGLRNFGVVRVCGPVRFLHRVSYAVEVADRSRPASTVEYTITDHGWLATITRWDKTDRTGRPEGDTGFDCPACGQAISATHDGDHVYYTECGGIGEGGCEAWCEGDKAAEAAHDRAARFARSVAL